MAIHFAKLRLTEKREVQYIIYFAFLRNPRFRVIIFAKSSDRSGKVRAATVTAALLGNVCDCQSLALVFLAAETSKEDSDCGDRGTQAADRGDGRHRLITGARK